jgi:Zn-dependent M28 family amino/carboxypeptidase
VSVLAELIGERNTAHPSALEAAREYIRRKGDELDLEIIEEKSPTIGRAGVNLEVTLRGSNAQSAPLIVGAHHDSVRGSPGADDNASAVAILLCNQLVRSVRRLVGAG